MQENNETKQYLQDDEIDLKELFLTIWKRKIFIIGFTFVVTVAAILFAILKTPIYEAKAVIEIGSYKDGSSKATLLDDVNKLEQELSITYIDILKNEQDRTQWIEDISVLKKHRNFLQIVSNALDNEKATDELNRVLKYIQEKHAKVIDEILNKKHIELRNIDREIELLKSNSLKTLDEDINYAKTIELPSLEEKIVALNKKQQEIRDQLKITEINIIKTQKQDPALTALNVMEKRSLEDSLSRLELQIIDLKNSKETLETKTIPRLLRKKEKLLNITLVQVLEEKTTLEQSLLPHNYKNSQVVGKVMTNEYPIKPKKKLIVVVAFVTGFILAIFLVFFMEFIKGFKEEDKEKISEAKA